MKSSVFKTEAELCAAFIDWARRQGYTAYPETAGFDILLVSPEGLQTGVEAKLRLNLKVIAQALPLYGFETGPDHRAVLVPSIDGDCRRLLQHIGIGVYYCTTLSAWHRGRHDFDLDGRFDDKPLFDWNPVRHCTLPEYMPDVAAGVPSPIQLTPWKISALKVLARLELSGSITRKEIAGFGIDARRWCGGDGWLTPRSGDRRAGEWVRGVACPKFDLQHPDVYAQIKAELAEVPRLGQVTMEIA